MDKRYQVFVSSTFEDLKEERKSVIEQIINFKHIPVGMEMFSASNEEQFKYIKKMIDNCDYYILIIGARYGTIDETTGKSFTEQEYDYALSKNIPILVFLHASPSDLPSSKREDSKLTELMKFRDKVSKNRLVKMWSDVSSLTSGVLIALAQEFSDNPQKGWVRGDQYDITEMLNELNQIRKENEELKQKNAELNIIVNRDIEIDDDLASGDDLFSIRVVEEAYDGYDRTYNEESIEVSWDTIFSSIGPYLYSTVTYGEYSSYLLDGIKSSLNENCVQINEADIQTIKFQLYALGLINLQQIELHKEVFKEMISLTEIGRKKLISVKTIKK